MPAAIITGLLALIAAVNLTLLVESSAAPVGPRAPEVRPRPAVAWPSFADPSQGYPLVRERGFALRFYWLAFQERYEHYLDEVHLYTPEGFPLGVVSEKFAKVLRLEGSGVLSDGRVVNYAGRCRYGFGTCFRALDPEQYPYGRGAGRRTLVPFRSVAVDPRVIPLGETLYIPELDGLRMPDGSVHDGCVRADDTGGGIKRRKMDFFVVSFDNYRLIADQLWGVRWVTPHIEHPRCRYLALER